MNMLNLKSLDRLGPTTKQMAMASGHRLELCQLFEFYSNMVGENDYNRLLEQVESVLDALSKGRQMVCYTYDDEMVIPNIVSNLLIYCGYKDNQSDNEVSYFTVDNHLSLRYADEDDDGRPCASILVNQ